MTTRRHTNQRICTHKQPNCVGPGRLEKAEIFSAKFIDQLNQKLATAEHLPTLVTADAVRAI